jgi:hypothetical protein
VLNRTGILKVQPAVAAHAGFITCGEYREAISCFVTTAALTRRRPGRIKLSQPGDARLSVRIVAVAAAPIVLIGLYRPAAVPPGRHLGQNRIMAAGALLGLKAAAGRLVYVGRVWVQRLFGNFAVAVQAHDLSVRRNVPARLVHQPIGAGWYEHTS